MELRTHIYDCKKPSQNQIPAWMRLQKEKTEEKPKRTRKKAAEKIEEYTELDDRV